MKLNKEFLSQVKYLKHNHILILLYLYQWVASNNPPKLKKFDDDRNYFWIAIDKLSNDLNLSRQQVQNALYRLENKDKSIQSSLQPFIFPKQVKKENKLYISINETMIPFIVSPEENEFINTVQKKLNGNTYNIKKIGEKKMLFEIEEEHKSWSRQAEMIVNKIINEYPNIFSTRIPKGKLTKTYSNCCKCVQDIFNGNFINSRIYPLSEKFLSNNQFNIDDWKNKIKEVKGDWNKTRQLILSSIKNYVLMFDEKRMPFRKENLTSSLSEWFYNSYNKGTYEQTSYFIYSLNEPNLTSKQLSENKADKIFDELPESVRGYGNDLVDLNKSMYPGALWEHIKEIYEWGNLLLDYDENARYWISKDGNIIQKFNEFIKEKNISVSVNTFDISKAVDCNGPWCWFISDAISNHSLNSKLLSCINEQDFYDCYNSQDNYEDEEIIF